MAANLSNQLFVDLPPEQPRSGGAEAAASNERKGRPGNKKTRENSNREGQQHRRKHKSLSPEKRLASTLAQSMSSISKSFEKLDLIGRLYLILLNYIMLPTIIQKRMTLPYFLIH